MADKLSAITYIFTDIGSDSEYSVIKRLNKTVHPLSDYRQVIVLMMTLRYPKFEIFFKYCVKKLIKFLSKSTKNIIT